MQENEMVALVPLAAIVLGCTTGMVGIIGKTRRQSAERKAREESRRELAAYVAEGTMTIEQAERLMAAGEKPGGGLGCGPWRP